MVIKLATILILAAPLFGQPKVTAIVSAANYSANTAGGSIASLFGTALATGTTAASTRPLPKILGGVEVFACELTGRPAPWRGCVTTELIFTSPTQINFIMPKGPAFTYASFSAGIKVRRDGIEDTAATQGAPFIVEVMPAAPGLFKMGYDCAYPTACPLTAQSDATHTMVRGAIVDQTGALVSSSNPIVPGKIYSLFYTGAGTEAGTPTFQAVGAGQNLVAILSFVNEGGLHYKGPAPGFSGLDQMNFELPSDLRRTFSPDGQSLPRCVELTADIRTELRLLLFAIVTPKEILDEVRIPVFIRKEELSCKR